jgi:ribokinase
MKGVNNLRAKGAGILIVTKGSDGCSIACGDFIKHIAAYKVAAVDPTGAGDVFNGVLAVATVVARTKYGGALDSSVIELAVRYASAAAALSVMEESAEGAAPSAHEIERFLALQSEKIIKDSSYG